MLGTAKMGLTAQILIALALGLVVGVLIHQTMPADGFVSQYLVEGLFMIIGKVFVKSLKMLVVPVVFVSLVCGVCSLTDIKQLGRLGIKTLLLYLGTTATAIALALFLSTLVNPGVGFDLPTEASFSAKDAPPLSEVFISLFPSNPIDSMAKGNMLQIITFSILFGISIALIGERGTELKKIFEDVNEVLMKFVGILMLIAPYGVFCLVANVFAKLGYSAIGNLALYFGVVIVTLLVHGLVTYPSILFFLGRLSPLRFFRKMEDPMAFAFSTASSSATLPVTLETVEHKLGVKNSVASFTIPLGATINMDGTAIMQGCATVFISQAYNIDIGFSGYLMVILTATLASIGTAGVPGVGLITLAMVLRQVGLPVEGIALVIGVDRLLDMCRTAVNVIGDASITCAVARTEDAIDLEVYNSNS